MGSGAIQQCKCVPGYISNGCWRLLKSQLETKGPGWYSPAEREETFFTNKSNRPGDDMKEAQEIFLDMYTQVREEEQIISPPYTRIQEDAGMRGRKKRKQGEDSALLG